MMTNSIEYKVELIKSVMRRFKGGGDHTVAHMIVIALNEPDKLKRNYPEVFLGLK